MQPHGISVSVRKLFKQVDTGMVKMITSAPATWPPEARDKFMAVDKASWRLAGEVELADAVLSVPHGAAIRVVINFVGAALLYHLYSHGHEPDAKLVLLDQSTCAKLSRMNGGGVEPGVRRRHGARRGVV